MQSSAELVCVDPRRVHEIWPHVAPLLRRAIVRTGLSAFAEIEQNILRGNALLWLAVGGEGAAAKIEAVASTTLQQTDSGKVCIITACAGANMARWLPLINHIEAYAKEEGCRCVRIFGRRGWMRVLGGYEESYIIMDKDTRNWPE
jgi:hypothetical protein